MATHPSPDVRVLDTHETLANQHADTMTGVTHAVLQLCAEIRGLRETVENLTNRRGRVEVESHTYHPPGMGPF